jgi:predicted transcriptional regulator
MLVEKTTKQEKYKMSKTLTEMAAEIVAARVKHESMTSKEIESCLNDTFEALQKLKEKEDVIPENAVETPEQPAQAKAEPGENTVEEPTDKPEQTPLKPEPDESPVETPIETPTEEPEQQEFAVEEPIEESEELSTPAVQAKKDTMAGTILSLIKSKPKGVDTKYIMEQTGFKKNQVWATVNRAKKMGQIKTTKRGIYVSVKARKGK